MKKVYLDYAATTPLDKKVLQAMAPYFTARWGNPGSLHSFGQEALAAVDGAREKIAGILGADFREIIFTASATEANNLALRGSIRGFTRMISGLTQKNISVNQLKISVDQRPRLIISAVEHESVLETARDLSRFARSRIAGDKDGVEVVVVPVDKTGRVDLKKLQAALDERTVLVSVM